MKEDDAHSNLREFIDFRYRSPYGPCKLVGQGYGHDVTVCSRKQSLNPPAEWRIFLGETRESRARPMDQQHPQVTVAAMPRHGHS